MTDDSGGLKVPWLAPGVPPPSAAKRTRPAISRSHPVATAFLDESGAIAKDRFFAIGMLKTAEPSRLLRRIQKLRDRTHWYNEIKFYDVTRDTLPFYRDVVDECLVVGDVQYFCFVADRQQHDPVARFGSPWDLYLKLAEQLVTAMMSPDELLTLLADNYSTPDHILFEEDLRESVNRRFNRLAVVSVCRLDSRSSDGLQLADLLTSATAFEFRADAGLASHKSPKGQLAAHVRKRLGTRTCLPKGWRNQHHSVQLYHVK